MEAMSARQIIREKRQELGLTQEALAALIGVNQFWVGNRECGKSAISLSDAQRLADAMGFSAIDWLRLRESVA